MKLRLFLTLIAVLAAHFAMMAQGSAHVSGRVIDAETEEGVPGAVIEVANVKSPNQKRYYTTEYGGYFRIPNVAEGEYQGLITFIGYADKPFTFKSVLDTSVIILPMRSDNLLDKPISSSNTSNIRLPPTYCMR